MKKHIHVIDCDSTQDILKEQLKAQNDADQILVSCENQNLGRGRGDNSWKAMPGTVCFSFNLEPHKILSYTAIEISVLLALFFENKGRALKLKWPNDLWDQNLKKCAGILVQSHQGKLLAGIGINLFSEDENFGGVFETSFAIDKKQWANDMADFILENRFSDTDILRREWLKRCGHLNYMVRVTEGAEVVEGIFQGLGEHGEAEVCRDTKTVRIYNGSLRMI